MSINKVILVGNLGTDPELRHSDRQSTFCTFSVATNHTLRSADNQRQNSTEWHHIVCFGKAAENSAKFLKKGRQVYVEGRIQSQKWEDNEGKERISNRIVANIIQFLGTKPALVTESCSPVEADQPIADEQEEDDFPF